MLHFLKMISSLLSSTTANECEILGKLQRNGWCVGLKWHGYLGHEMTRTGYPRHLKLRHYRKMQGLKFAISDFRLQQAGAPGLKTVPGTLFPFPIPFSRFSCSVFPCPGLDHPIARLRAVGCG
jgi:hypothetical protein